VRVRALAAPDIAWKPQLRLNAKFKRLVAHRVMRNKAVVAVARELSGFVWAIGREVQASAWKGIDEAVIASYSSPLDQQRNRCRRTIAVVRLEIRHHG
jgi:hypothetical protein